MFLEIYEHWLCRNAFMRKYHIVNNCKVFCGFYILFYLCNAGERHSHRRKKAFCFKSKTGNRQNHPEDRNNQCSFCVYTAYVRSVHKP